MTNVKDFSKFRKLGISEELMKAIEEEGFTEPSEIQAKSIPLVLEGRDVIAGAATGSGKTLAFGAAIIKQCVHGSGIQTLVLTPTRELAEQVSGALRTFSKYKRLHVSAVYGGVSLGPQVEELRKADVVVGTPGRLLDHMERKTFSLEKVKILVLDEADRMLDMGFIEDVEMIINACPKKRQTLLFSATISDEISRLAWKYMKNPSRVSAESYVDPKKLKQFYYDVHEDLKFSLLLHLLRHEKTGLVMVFCNTRRNVDFVAHNLKLAGVNAQATHGGFSQDKRNKTLEMFHSKSVYVLVCTDVAARGLDIPDVSHIYNYDTPEESKQYIHRIGRTARAGAEGKAVSILAVKDHEKFRRILRDNDVEIKKMVTPHFERVRTMRSTSEHSGFHGRSGDGRFGKPSHQRSRFGQKRPNWRR